MEIYNKQFYSWMSFLSLNSSHLQENTGYFYQRHNFTGKQSWNQWFTQFNWNQQMVYMAIIQILMIIMSQIEAFRTIKWMVNYVNRAKHHLWALSRRYLIKVVVASEKKNYCLLLELSLSPSSHLENSGDSQRFGFTGELLIISRVQLNRLWFVIHDKILKFHDWILCNYKPFHNKIKRCKSLELSMDMWHLNNRKLP